MSDRELISVAEATGCPSGDCTYAEAVFALLGKRWNGLIIDLLLASPARFSAIIEALPQLSKRVLSQRLAELTEAGLVERDERGPREVVYRLTEHGRGLGPAMAELRIWAGSPEPPPTREDFVEQAGAGKHPADRAVWESLDLAARRLQDALDRQAKTVAAVPGVYAEALARLRLAPECRMRVGDLAAATGLKSSRVSGMVAHFEESGWALRTADPTDQRSWTVTLTEAGKAVAAAIQPVYTGILHDHLYGALTEAEQAQLRRLTDKILASFETTTEMK
ncbi:winged helix-turn-helix transcriptional regulator [Glycomyces dulcitolivorans]|uniref:winged helix-turn-helix transcriptional regulator n=1 Tax=Glycomyces dulcitolivorans TaxID=2200759 RepID=UPI00130049E5|nr:winged helix-turn-helix transcriptional regulator [Glycomyces dulcitolivorans]